MVRGWTKTVLWTCVDNDNNFEIHLIYFNIFYWWRRYSLWLCYFIFVFFALPHVQGTMHLTVSFFIHLFIIVYLWYVCLPNLSWLQCAVNMAIRLNLINKCTLLLSYKVWWEAWLRSAMSTESSISPVSRSWGSIQSLSGKKKWYMY